MKNQKNEMSVNGEQNLCLKFCKVCFGLSLSMGKIHWHYIRVRQHY